MHVNATSKGLIGQWSSYISASALTMVITWDCVLRICCSGVQTPVQKYWKDLLRLIEAGQLTPEMVRDWTFLHMQG